MSEWNKLSMQDKASYIRDAVSLGVYDVDTIRNNYHLYSAGGNIFKGGGWFNQHKDKWYSFLVRRGVSVQDADRLSGFFAALDGVESAAGKSNAAIKHNNFGGMQKAGKNIHYDSVEDYMQDKWSMMNRRFSDALKANTLEEFATVLGDPARAGKNYLYYVADGYNSKDPHNSNWMKAQNTLLNNYIAGMLRFYGTPNPRKVIATSTPYKNTSTASAFSASSKGPIYEVLPRLLRDAGLDVRVSSGYRPVGAVGTAGSRSWHPRHGAVDIVPQGKTTFEDIENAIYNNPAIYDYMLANNFGLLDESGRSQESRNTMKKTGATGAHFHFGKDSVPATNYANRMRSLLGLNYAPYQNQSTFQNQSTLRTNSYTSIELLVLDTWNKVKKESLGSLDENSDTTGNIIDINYGDPETTTLEQEDFKTRLLAQNIINESLLDYPRYTALYPNTLLAEAPISIAPVLTEVSTNPDEYLADLYNKYYKYNDGGVLLDNTRVNRSIYFPTPLKIDLSNEATLGRANRVYSNYSDAVDSRMSKNEERVRNTLRYLKDNVNSNIPSGISNCTLSASQWIDPTNPIMKAATIYNNPELYGYIPISPEIAVPGNMIIAKNPSSDSYHTMIISGFAPEKGLYDFEGTTYEYEKGEPLVTYSRGGNDDSFLRKDIPLSVYTANSDGKNELTYYRYKYPNEIYLDTVLVTGKKHSFGGPLIKKLKAAGGSLLYNSLEEDIPAEEEKPNPINWDYMTTKRKEGYRDMKDIWDYFIKKGMSLRNTAALMGNMMQESSFDPYVVLNSNDKASGYFLMHGDKLKQYILWLEKNNREHSKYSLIDFIVDLLAGNVEDLYTKEYNRIDNRIKELANKPRRTKLEERELREYKNLYKKNNYEERIRTNTMYPYSQMIDMFNNNSHSLEDITDIFTNSYERAGKPRYKQRRQYALDILNRFGQGTLMEGTTIRRHALGGEKSNINWPGLRTVNHNVYPDETFIALKEELHRLESSEGRLKPGYQFSVVDYLPDHRTILKKYSDFPKQFRKLYKNGDVRTVTDNKGNTWYEVDVPEDYLNQEWLFGLGGVLSEGGALTTTEDSKNTSEGRRPGRPMMPIHPVNREKDPEAYDRYIKWQQDVQKEDTIREQQARVKAELRLLRQEAKAAAFRRKALPIFDDLKAGEKPLIAGEDYKQAVDAQLEEARENWIKYKNAINAGVTVAELLASGSSLLGAYSNWKNWARSANLIKQRAANILQKAQLPLQVGGTVIDGYQVYDAILDNDLPNAIYNSGSGGLGIAGSVGASDVFLTARFHNPRVDRVFDVAGVILNFGDYLNFGYNLGLGLGWYKSPFNKKDTE